MSSLEKHFFEYFAKIIISVVFLSPCKKSYKSVYFILMRYNRLNPSLALFLCAFLWSTSGILIKLTDWNALAISGTRSLIGALTMIIALKRIPKLFVRDENNNIDKKQSIDRIIATLVYAATMILFVFANKMTTSANAILLQYTSVLYVIALGPFLLGEKNSFIDILASFGILGGMALLVSDGFTAESFNSVSMAGNILALLSGVCFGLTTIFMRRQKDGHPEDSFTLSHLLTFLVAIPAIIEGGVPNTQSIGAILILGIFQIGIPSILYSMGVTRVTAISAALITMLEPVMNPVWVFFFWGESPSTRTILGGVTILAFLFFRVYIKNKSINKKV